MKLDQYGLSDDQRLAVIELHGETGLNRLADVQERFRRSHAGDPLHTGAAQSGANAVAAGESTVDDLVAQHREALINAAHAGGRLAGALSWTSLRDDLSAEALAERFSVPLDVVESLLGTKTN